MGQGERPINNDTAATDKISEKVINIMITNYSKKLVTAGLMLALGIILPYATAHGFGLSGNILLPMHIPVLLSGFLCGPLYGFFCGLLLPVTNSLLTGMPAIYPMAVIMTCELSVYGLVSGLMYKGLGNGNVVFRIYISLIVAMISGRAAYGLVLWLMLISGTDTGRLSVIAAVATGLPGIAAQLVLIPAIVSRIGKTRRNKADGEAKARNMIHTGEASCVTVKSKRIATQSNSRGISYIIDLYEKGELKDAYVADKVVGKAAAMIFTLGGVAECYAENISDGAAQWFDSHSLPYEYRNRSAYIVNRKGDGMCPMEHTVMDIEDEHMALKALKEKISQM